MNDDIDHIPLEYLFPMFKCSPPRFEEATEKDLRRMRKLWPYVSEISQDHHGRISLTLQVNMPHKAFAGLTKHICAKRGGYG